MRLPAEILQTTRLGSASALGTRYGDRLSNLPDAPTITRVTQGGVVELAWTLPMQLFVPRGDLRTVRQTLLPFFDAYLAAFLPQWTLGGLCLASWISSVKVESDADWAWLAMDLHVEELLNYG